MDRREFLISSGVIAATAVACKNGISSSSAGSEVVLPEGSMPEHYPGVGLLGFGCMRWPSSDESGELVIDQEKVNEMVDYAMEHGVNYFDSAPVYLKGKSEEATAIALQRHPRSSYLIATKASNFSGPYTLEQGVSMFEKSLAVYKTTYIDYYLLHSVGSYSEFKERYLDNGLMTYLLSQRKEGRIRNLGFSFHGDYAGWKEMLALHPKYHWDFIQIQMNYMDWNHSGPWNTDASILYKSLEEADIPVVIMEPLLGGSLASLPAPLADRLKAAEPSASAASWSFRFCGSFPKVLTVLSGMTCMEHLQDNLATFLDFRPLADSDYPLLEETAVLLEKFSRIKCTGCRYCMPCPYGIDIPGLFAFYNKTVTEGTYVVSPEQKNYKRARRAYLLAYDKAVLSASQADHCIACGQCTPKCPQHLSIPGLIHKIDTYIEDLRKG